MPAAAAAMRALTRCARSALAAPWAAVAKRRKDHSSAAGRRARHVRGLHQRFRDKSRTSALDLAEWLRALVQLERVEFVPKPQLTPLTPKLRFKSTLGERGSFASVDWHCPAGSKHIRLDLAVVLRRQHPPTQLRNSEDQASTDEVVIHSRACIPAITNHAPLFSSLSNFLRRMSGPLLLTPPQMSCWPKGPTSGSLGNLGLSEPRGGNAHITAPRRRLGGVQKKKADSHMSHPVVALTASQKKE